MLQRVDTQLEKMAHPRSPWTGLHRGDGGTSFTSSNTDNFSDFSPPPSTINRNGPAMYGASEHIEGEKVTSLNRSQSHNLDFHARKKEEKNRNRSGSTYLRRSVQEF